MLVVVPFPSSPPSLAPQQYAAPAGFNPQVYDPPATIVVKPMPPDTGTGVALPVVEPLPSSPAALLPQHDAAPEAATMQVCAEPAAIMGWTVVLGPVESLQALDMAATMARETGETPCRMDAAKLTFPCAPRPPPYAVGATKYTCFGTVTRTAATPPDPPPPRGAREECRP